MFFNWRILSLPRNLSTNNLSPAVQDNWSGQPDSHDNTVNAVTPNALTAGVEVLLFFSTLKSKESVLHSFNADTLDLRYPIEKVEIDWEIHKEKRHKIAYEILTTEQTYVRTLQTLTSVCSFI